MLRFSVDARKDEDFLAPARAALEKKFAWMCGGPVQNDDAIAVDRRIECWRPATPVQSNSRAAFRWFAPVAAAVKRNNLVGGSCCTSRAINVAAGGTWEQRDCQWGCQ